MKTLAEVNRMIERYQRLYIALANECSAENDQELYIISEKLNQLYELQYTLNA